MSSKKESVIVVLKESIKKKQSSAKETVCMDRNQPSVMAVGGLRLRQMAPISEKVR